MEEVRQRRIRDASLRTEPLTEKERLLFVQGVGEHTVGVLGQVGINSVEQLNQASEETLLRETGLGLRKVRQIKQGGLTFLSSELKVIEDAQRSARAVAREAAAREAEAAAAETPAEPTAEA
jgi:N utilization substance protein A